MGKDSDFKEDDRIKCLLWCDRHCCLCGKSCGVDIELAHILAKEEGGTGDIDNAIPLCYDCHAKYGHYNSKHPKGSKYRLEEVKRRREQIYEQYTRHLVPPIDIQITQRSWTGGLYKLPKVGFNITHIGNSLPVWVLVSAKVLHEGKELKWRQEPYAGKQRWNMNPGQVYFCHFSIPKDTKSPDTELSMVFDITVIDQYEREHKLLPYAWKYKWETDHWVSVPNVESLYA